MDAVCGAGQCTVTDERVNRRNDYRRREWNRLAGTIVELAVPKPRRDSYFSGWLLEPRRRAEHALVAVMADCHPASPQGGSTNWPPARSHGTFKSKVSSRRAPTVPGSSGSSLRCLLNSTTSGQLPIYVPQGSLATARDHAAQLDEREYQPPLPDAADVRRAAGWRDPSYTAWTDVTSQFRDGV